VRLVLRQREDVLAVLRLALVDPKLLRKNRQSGLKSQVALDVRLQRMRGIQHGSNQPRCSSRLRRQRRREQ